MLTKPKVHCNIASGPGVTSQQVGRMEYVLSTIRITIFVLLPDSGDYVNYAIFLKSQRQIWDILQGASSLV